MTFTGSKINFGIAVVGGILLGSFVSAKISGEFRIEAFVDASDLKRHLSGGALMGTGGVLALGCTIGQGAEWYVDAGAWLFNCAFIDHCWRRIWHEIPRRRQCHRGL